MSDQTKIHEYYQKLGAISVSDNFTYHAKRKWHKTPLAISGVLALSFAVLGTAVALKHGSLAPIRLAGVPIHATASNTDIQKSVMRAAGKYSLRIKYPDGSEKSYALAEAGVRVDAAASADSAKSAIRKSFFSDLIWWKPVNIELKTKVDQKALDGFIAGKATIVTEAPVDASLSLEGGKVTITPAKTGKGSRIIGVSGAIRRSASTLNASPLKMTNAALPVSIRDSDLESSRAKAQELVSKPVAFSIAGHEVVAGPGDIAGWLDLNPVPQSKTVDVTVDSGKILQYINSMARRYITLPRSRLVTNTSTGRVVLDPGADGVDVVNKDQTATTVARQLSSDKQLNVALNVQYTPASTVETQAYDKWFVADVTNKRMYAYEGTNLVRSFLISAGAPATPTVLGDYAVYRKFVSQDMRGNNADGSRYFQPAVPYVNYFFGDYAIHGNYWRPASYFGNINSSHGCIGVTVSDGAWIYDWATIGTHVIVHK